MTHTRNLLQQKELQDEASRMRDAILEGYQDAINGKTVVFAGDLRSLLEKAVPQSRTLPSSDG